jgi:hypothetical protein
LNLEKLCAWFVDLEENKRKNILGYLKEENNFLSKYEISFMTNKEIINLHELISGIERELNQKTDNDVVIKQLISYDIDKANATLFCEFTDENSKHFTSGLLLNLFDKSMLDKIITNVVKEKPLNFDHSDFSFGEFQYNDTFKPDKYFIDIENFIRDEVKKLCNRVTDPYMFEDLLLDKYKIQPKKAYFIVDKTFET